jgi:hypothetical protein
VVYLVFSGYNNRGGIQLINDCDLCDGIGRAYDTIQNADGEYIFMDVICPNCLGKKFRRRNGHAKPKHRSTYKQEYLPYDNPNKIPLKLRSSGITWVMGGTGITWLVATKVKRRLYE